MFITFSMMKEKETSSRLYVTPWELNFKKRLGHFGEERRNNSNKARQEPLMNFAITALG